MEYDSLADHVQSPTFNPVTYVKDEVISETCENCAFYFQKLSDLQNEIDLLRSNDHYMLRRGNHIFAYHKLNDTTLGSLTINFTK